MTWLDVWYAFASGSTLGMLYFLAYPVLKEDAKKLWKNLFDEEAFYEGYENPTFIRRD